MSDTSLPNIIEGALLAAGKPMTVAQICELFEEHEKPDTKEVREALQEVASRCEGRGFELAEVASGFRFQVRQSLSPWVGRLWQERPAKYSRALLETLALVAYRQPITRGEIEEIRGVAVSSNIIKTLHEREWIRVVGHRDVPGRPAMYATTRQFLDYFNLKSLDQLPALAEIRDLETLNAELGFSDPLPESAGDAAKVAPGLTVVGGTEHRPAAGPEAAGGDAAQADEPDPAMDPAQNLFDGEGEGAVPAQSTLGANPEDIRDESPQPDDVAGDPATTEDASMADSAAEAQIEPENADDLASAMAGMHGEPAPDEDADEASMTDPTRPESQG
ncbi:SMC-Scp complex subunit ScpB [Haliea sp. E17]|uniref:SMC-Scp complex subunit ScpB n=1 Tax=Haliea sp. E17 TaxID=3401576 RepID=UPI003AADAFEB